MNLKFYLVLLGAIVLSPALKAQCIDITLSSQSDVDSYQSAYGCSVIAGTLTITGSDITNLDGLSGVTSVNFLRIADNPNLISIQGLSALTTVGASANRESIIIRGNSKLENLDGLEGITTIPGTLTIQDHAVLTSIDGFSSLTTFNGPGASMYINGNLILENVDGLSNLSTFTAGEFGGVISISTNPALKNVDGLSSLKHLDGGSWGKLSISNNASLLNLDGLASLERISTDSPTRFPQLEIWSNSSLESGCGLWKILTGPGGTSCRSYVPANDPYACIEISFGYNGNGITEEQIIANCAPPPPPCMSFTLTTQAQVDAFKSTGCTVVEDWFEVSGNDITNLDSLAGLTKVTRLRVHDNPNLKSLDLPNLQQMVGDAMINNNPRLKNFDGLTSLTTVSTLEIFDNDSINSLEGLSNLTVVRGSFAVTRHPMLQNLQGLGGITTVPGNFAINDNDMLTDLTGVGIVSAGTVTVDGNNNLENLHGLESLTTIVSYCCNPYQGLIIHGNPKLTNLDELSNLTLVGGMVSLVNNVTLTNINGLSSLTGIGRNAEFGEQSIQLQDNPMLTSIAPFGNVTNFSGGIRIINNDALTDLHGLENATAIYGYGVEITGNDKLISLSALSKVKTINIAVTIRENASLPNLNGLQSLKNLEWVRGSGTAVVIVSNPMLTNVDSLSSLTSMTGSSKLLNVIDNPNLSKGCGLYPVVSTQFNCGTSCPSYVEYNFTGSNVTWQQIKDGGPCSPGGTVTCTGSLTLSSQAEVDAFPAQQGCTVINGSLTISGTDITNVDSLYSITRIARSLILENNPSLVNIDGLSSLTSVSRSDNGTSGMIQINHNAMLTNIDGLSSVDSVGYYGGFGDGSISIYQNESLTSIEGLRSIKWLPGGMTIIDNDSLTNLDGLDSLTGIDYSGGLSIADNSSLVDIDALKSLTSLAGSLNINGNASLPNLNGLSSLTSVGGGYSSAIHIEDNPVLTNVDSLSALIHMSSLYRSLIVKNNPNLTRGCGFYPLLANSFNCSACQPLVVFENNGAGVTEEEIMEAGACEGVDPQTPPTNLVFSEVTDNSMTVAFSAGAGNDGYITIMRAFESALPDWAPQDGTTYSTGNVIGCCTIVVGLGTDTSLNIIYLEGDIDYYFDVIPYTIDGTSYVYHVSNALSGHQRTMPRAQPYPNPFVEQITIPFTISEESANVKIVIMDQLGRVISEVVNQSYDNGKHEVLWDRSDQRGNKVGEGVYMYSISTNTREPVKGLVVAK